MPIISCNYLSPVLYNWLNWIHLTRVTRNVIDQLNEWQNHVTLATHNNLRQQIVFMTDESSLSKSSLLHNRHRRDSVFHFRVNSKLMAGLSLQTNGLVRAHTTTLTWSRLYHYNFNREILILTILSSLLVSFSMNHDYVYHIRTVPTKHPTY